MRYYRSLYGELTMSEFSKKVDLFELMQGDADVYTVEEFNELCDTSCLIDYDGFGHPITGEGMMDPAWCLVPSQRHTLPDEVTHIQWFNR